MNTNFWENVNFLSYKDLKNELLSSMQYHKNKQRCTSTMPPSSALVLNVCEKQLANYQFFQKLQIFPKICIIEIDLRRSLLTYINSQSLPNLNDILRTTHFPKQWYS